jgi:hypothetical protein
MWRQRWLNGCMRTVPPESGYLLVFILRKLPPSGVSGGNDSSARQCVKHQHLPQL